MLGQKYNPLTKRGFNLIRIKEWIQNNFSPTGHQHAKITDGTNELRQQGDGSYATGDLTVAGAFVVEGGYTEENVQKKSVLDNIIFLNHGEEGTGITEGQAGHEYDRGSANPYRHIFSESNKSVRLGEYYVSLTVDSDPGFQQFEKIVGQTSGSSAYIASISTTTFTLKNITGSFQDGETIEGQTSTVTASVQSTTLTDNTQPLTTRPDSSLISDEEIALWDNQNYRLKFVPNVLHSHDNKTVLDAIIEANSGKVITVSERDTLHSIADSGDVQGNWTQKDDTLPDYVNHKPAHDIVVGFEMD